MLRTRVAVKLVAQSGIGQVAVGVAKAGADVIHVSGHDGGTGASPLGSIKHAGIPWELGLTDVHDALTANALRDRVLLRVDGGFKTGRDVVVAAALGADRFAFGSALLVALGCIYARQCHKNTCPVGIATQDRALRAKFAGTAEQGAQFFTFVAHDVRRRLAALGAHTLAEIRGRRDLLRARAFEDPAMPAIDLSALTRLSPKPIVVPAQAPPEPAHIDDRIDDATQAPLRIGPWDRTAGSRISSQRRGAPVTIRYSGTAGQSFGAFCTHGTTLLLDGDANDYVGKSMDGGRIVVRGAGSAREPAIGNACFYGARGGEAFVRGTAGERFAVRNSGATLVVEGAGDHACEYMTAGFVVILGPTGRNLASGMTGGAAFVFSPTPVELQMGPADLDVAPCREDDLDLPVLHRVLMEHVEATGSATARELLLDWPRQSSRFVAIRPPGERARPDAAYVKTRDAR